MANLDPKACLITAAQIAATPEIHVRQPFNPNSQVYLRSLGQAAGLARQQLAIGRIPPGKDSFELHAHARDEEFLYVLSGRGRAQIGDELFEVGPGDFMGFTAPSPAHNLSNPYGEDLVYLMGGERSGLDVVDFPRAGKTAIFSAEGIQAADSATLQPMSFGDYLPDGLPEAILKRMAGRKKG